MRGRQMIRHWRLLRLIHDCRYMTVTKLARELAVSTKTIRRDLAVLEQAGFPLYQVNHTGYERFFRMQRDWFLQGGQDVRAHGYR
jgi:predicted DNA-binding transcriptional regulator YafY